MWKTMLQLLNSRRCGLNHKIMQAVLHDDLLAGIELTWVYCAKITNKQLTSKIVLQLQDIYPLENLQHLKRVRSSDQELQVLIAHKDKSKLEIIQSTANIPGLTDFHLTQVPKQKPLTRQQYTEAKAFWPCSFHENKIVEKQLKHEFFTVEEVKKLKQYMSIAVEEASLSSCLGLPGIGAIIVDPTSGEVLARAHTSDSSSHPLRHAVMLCINQVAVEQGGITDSRGLEEIENECIHDLPAKRCKTEPYLCSGYDIFVSLEPCVMCSMALVHSRIGRVFYRNNDCIGALGSQYKIHCQAGLNHHFAVFKEL